MLVVTAPFQAASGSSGRYLDELIHRAGELNLADERVWHLLLHYRNSLWGGDASEADDPGFFLSPEGRHDARAELEATLAQFFSDELVGRSKQPAQCAFIARYHWLHEHLRFDPERLPPQRCERFENWYAELNPDAITLIFASAFMNNPASMFGHTLLRVDQRGQTEHTRILAYTINYAADVPPDPGLMYAVYGIGGGYRGYFSTVPYYLKVQEYGDIENRDLWEYRLNFSHDQIRRLLMHAWELGNASFDYYFFKENCSYHLLSLLEVADPNLHLRDRFIFWTVPADTVRLLGRQPGLVADIVYRPARSSVIKRTRDTLTAREQQWLGLILERPEQTRSEGFEALPLARRARVLDLASDYLLYKAATSPERSETYKAKNRTVLVERSRLRVRSEAVPVPPFMSPPDTGHGTSRVGLGVGWRNDEAFEEVTIRPGYHDLLDPDAGYTPDAQIELLSVRVRHYEDRDQTRLDGLTLASVVSLSPIDALFHPPSWKVNAGLQTVSTDRCGLCSEWNGNAGIGAAFESGWVGREVFFAFAEADANYSEGYEENHRVGGGGTVGILATLGARWKVLSSATYLGYPLGDRSDDLRAFAGLRVTIAQNWAARFEFNHRDDDDQGVFSVQAFF